MPKTKQVPYRGSQWPSRGCVPFHALQGVEEAVIYRSLHTTPPRVSSNPGLPLAWSEEHGLSIP